MMRIPFFRHSVDEELSAAIEAGIRRVYNSGRYILADEVKRFETEFAAFCGVGNCISVANGTDALEIAMRAVGIDRGDRVLLAANAGFYASSALHIIGATPEYVDVSPATLNLSVDNLAERLHSGPKAIVVTHLYGKMADMEGITKLAEAAGVRVIEDCSQAHGAAAGGTMAGAYGATGCFSFYPTKNLGALGDGGAVVTDDGTVAGRVRALRQYGWRAKYHSTVPGGRNSRMDEIQAAVLRAKLPHLEAWNNARREIARRYNDAFTGLPLLCPEASGGDYVAHLYTLRLKGRDSLREYLRSKDIATDVHYPVPDHLQPAYPCRQLAGDLPVTEDACSTVLSLPCFPDLQRGEVEYVCETVQSFFESGEA